jgi:hypothetical protein
MRMIARILLLMAAIAVIVDVAPLATGTPWEEIEFTDLGTVWFRVHPDSLQLLEPAIARHVSPALWDYGVLPLLTTPIAVVLAVLAALAWLLRRRAREDRTRRRDPFRRR